MLTRQIEKAQRKVESHNFDIRKQLLLFDDVANDQRKVVYQQRTEIMGTEDLSAAILGIMEESVGSIIDQHLPKSAAVADWDLQGLSESLQRDFNVGVDPKTWLAQEPELEEQALRDRIVRAATDSYKARAGRAPDVMRHVEKEVMLKMLDQHWREHLAAMDYLRQGIHLRGYAQKDYRFEYKREAFELFAALLDRVKFETVSLLAKIEIRSAEEIDREEEERRQRLMRALQAQHAEAQSVLNAEPAPAEALPVTDNAFGLPGAVLPGIPGAMGPGTGQRPMPTPPPADAQGTFVRGDRKVGRNELCPCGSGKKFKHCHGALQSVE
jgi:preprotein translocase subunit SecA